MDDDFSDRAFSTRAVWSGTNHLEGSAVTPIFTTSTYQLNDDRYRDWADGGQHSLIYSRWSSVNSEAVASKVASLEGAEDGETLASGMAAISSTLLSMLSKGDHMVTSPDIYGGTYGLLTSDFPRFGIDVTMADIRDPSSFEAAIIATPWACQPISMGFDVVIHSGTKFLNGHSDLTAGIVVGRSDLIKGVFKTKTRLGGTADAFMCYLLERGMRTLHARMPIHASNSSELARRMQEHPEISAVNHPSLESYADYEVAKRIVPNGTGMLSFVVRGGDERAMRFVRALEIIFEATSLGGIESLVSCPFNTSDIFVPEEDRLEAGIVPGFVRMSVGIEDVDDLWSDIE